MPTLSPAHDTLLVHPYSYTTLEQKGKNKTALQEEIGWAPEPRRPVLCLPSGMNDALGGALFLELIPAMLSTPVELLILGRGSADYGKAITKLQRDHNHRVSIVAEDEQAVHRMFAASDMALFLTEPGAKELSICLHYAVIPVSRPTDTLENYDPVQERGNAFVIDGTTVWHAFSALVRAIETYKFPYDWRTIQKHAMESVRG